MDVVEKAIGAEGDVKVTVGAGGVCIVTATYAGTQAKAELTVEVSADALLAALEEHVDNAFGKGAIEMLRSGLKLLPETAPAA